MSRLRLDRSPIQALVLFWPFQSLPRLWFLATSPIPDGGEPLTHVALPLAVGFLRDGLLVAALLLPIQIAHGLGGERWIPARVRRGVRARLSRSSGRAGRRIRAMRRLPSSPARSP